MKMGKVPRTPAPLRGIVDIECAGFQFYASFDSANLGKVEHVPATETASITPMNSTGRPGDPEATPDVEFNIWTKPDCCGTEFENTHRTWFYFGMRASSPELLVKLNMIDLNRQERMYNLGMAPVYRILPGKMDWERIPGKPTYGIYTAGRNKRSDVDETIFTMSFKYRTPKSMNGITYFAFTYPFPYTEHIDMLKSIDNRFTNFEPSSRDDIYYTREIVCYSLEGRRIDLLTISSYHNISSERETRLKNLFPEQRVLRPFRFFGKKVIFVSARVHPGETPSSFVFNGLLNLLLNRENSVAMALRRLYVFKLIPILNPDGVAKGHYRSDTRGLDLNRVYLDPSLDLHPSIYAARALIEFYHYGYQNGDDHNVSYVKNSRQGATNDNKLSKKLLHTASQDNWKHQSEPWCSKWKDLLKKVKPAVKKASSMEVISKLLARCKRGDFNSEDTGLFLYMDLHSHFSEKGIFMYGNHFEDQEDNIECMVLAKIMSMNNHNFHFYACNFTERNMYVKDRVDGISKGCGRVAVMKLTGLIRSYTLECNYNTGRVVNILPCTIKETNAKTLHSLTVPPKYTPHVFEKVGRALGASILDLTNQNPITRLPNSQFRTLKGLREWLRSHCHNGLGESQYRLQLRNSASLNSPQGKSARTVVAPSTSVRYSEPTFINSFTEENLFDATPKPRSKSFSTVQKECTLNAKGNTSNKTLRSNCAVQTLESASCGPKNKHKVISSKLHPIKGKPKETKSSDSDDSGRIKAVQEIWFVKSPEGKRMIAKYNTKEDSKKSGEDNLVVAWDIANNPHVFSHKTRGPGIQDLQPLPGEPVPNRVGGFRVHNFAKNSSVQRPPRPLTKMNRLKMRKC